MAAHYQTRPVWSGFIRLWHWLLVISVVAGWLLGYFRDFSIMQWHFYAGYVTGVLLLFRVVAGVFGSDQLRFSSLLFRPKDIVSYLSGVTSRTPSGMAGHNPLGALSVIAMLLALTVQVITGLFSEDDALFYSGPLANTISESLRLGFISVHHISATVILWLVGLHVAAVLFYLFWKKENLIVAMISGNKLVRDSQEQTSHDA